MPSRREPERTCVGCRATAAKAELMRVVRGPDGSVEVDPTGRAPGRGAYVHARAECVRLASRGRTLARALRATLDGVQVARLMEGLEESVEVEG